MTSANATKTSTSAFHLGAEETAEQLFNLYGFDIPVDPIWIAKQNSIEVIDSTFKEKNISGMITRDFGKTVIYVRYNDAPNRKKFTIAHELGHYFLHLFNKDGGFMDRNTSFLRTEYDHSTHNSKEREANQFAAALLMPQKRVYEEWPKFREEWELYRTVEEIAHKFSVSVAAMEIRLKTLGLLSR